MTLSVPIQSGEERSGQSLLARDHFVTITIEDETLIFKFHCNAKAGSMCSVRCNDDFCESWNQDHQEETGHELVAIEKCNFVEWMDATGQDHFYLDGFLGNSPVVLRQSPIDIEWADGYTWSFIDVKDTQ